MGKPMSTSQDFVNWICADRLDHNFLKYLFLAEGDGLLRFASGAVHQTIYFPEVKAFHICHPPLEEQRRIVAKLDAVSVETERLDRIYRRRALALAELKSSVLWNSFTGIL